MGIAVCIIPGRGTPLILVNEKEECNLENMAVRMENAAAAPRKVNYKMMVTCVITVYCISEFSFLWLVCFL